MPISATRYLGLSTLTLLFACLLCWANPAQAAVPAGISCKSFLIYDLTADETSAVLNAEHRQPIASLTKLMTSILACEKLRFDGRYILTESEQKNFGVDTMRGDKMLEMMLVSSNNATCKMVARIIAGNETKFADLMNQKAREIGLEHTRFVNASGLPGEGQYSTMFDLLRLTISAMKYPRILDSMHSGCVECGGQKYEATLEALYKRHPGLWGGKTGYTKAAGRCLILLYNSGGHDYCVITLGSKGVKDSFRDAEIILKANGLYSGEVAAWK